MTLLERCKSIAKKKLLENISARNRSKQKHGRLAHRYPHKKENSNDHIHLAEKKKEKPGSEVNTDPELENTIALER